MVRKQHLLIFHKLYHEHNLCMKCTDPKALFSCLQVVVFVPLPRADACEKGEGTITNTTRSAQEADSWRGDGLVISVKPLSLW